MGPRGVQVGWGVRGGETGKASYSIWVFSCWNGKAGKQNGLIGSTFLKDPSCCCRGLALGGPGVTETS